VRLAELRVDNLRVFESLVWRPGRGVNWLVGPNGAGKSSVLEAVSLLSAGRSFRTLQVESCIRRGADALSVFAELASSDGGVAHRIGLARRARGFEARCDGQRLASLSELFAVFPAMCLQADAAELILGGGEGRRRFLDWGLFHVEPDFIPVWRAFQRVLKQRNRGLRLKQSGSQDAAYRRELADRGTLLHAMRAEYVARLLPWLVEACSLLMAGLGAPRLVYRPGWPAASVSYLDALENAAETDGRLGYTGLGPQRAGWSLSFEALPQRELMSRGQAKLASLSMLLAQVALFKDRRAEAPVLCLDDTLSELDSANQSRVLGALESMDVQVLIACADPALAARCRTGGDRLFHVEQGTLSPEV